MKTIDAKCVLTTSSTFQEIITNDSFQDIITITHVDASRIKHQIEESIRGEITNTNSFLMILVQKGTAEISLDYKTYYITPEKLAFIIPNHIFRISEISSDFSARFLVMDKFLLEETLRGKKSSYNYISFKKKPLITVERKEKADLEKALLLLRDKIRLHSHIFHTDIVHNATSALLLEFLNILFRKNSDQMQLTFTRREDIVDRFLKLLSEHAKEEHSLSFYADKLFITPQYLSAILKDQTGKSGSKWINEALIMEAKKLIRSPRSTIQDVAYALNFSDQSTFGKFFKKSIGMSPLVYRRSS